MSWREVVIGFDTRTSLDEVRARWDDEERRDTFLLRPDADAPLSVDEAVWPRRGAQSVDDDGPLAITTPRFRRLAELVLAPGEVGIALTRLDGPGEPPLPCGPGEPATVDPSWELLGWDVVSGVFPSAVSNCGYRPDEVLEWRRRFAEAFDPAHHLLVELPFAFAFRDATNRRVPEHAPFGVFGLYRLTPRTAA